MSETEMEIETRINGMIDQVIKILMNNDYRGVLLMEIEGYNDIEVYELPPKVSPTIMRKELEYVMDKIFEITKIAETLNNLDIKKEIFEMASELEEDWGKVYNSIETESEQTNIRNKPLPVKVKAIETGGIANVFDKA